MTLDPVSAVLSQIEYLVFSLNKKTAKVAVLELQNVSFEFFVFYLLALVTGFIFILVASNLGSR